jgi:glycosyl transferase family 87
VSTLSYVARPRAVARALLRRPTAAAAVVCLVSFAAFWLAQRATHVSMIDLMVYRAEGWAVRGGHDLYAIRATHASLPATYPPFAALLFTPLTLLSVSAMRTLATAGNLALLVVLVHLSLRLIERPLPLPRPAAALLLASAAVWCEPVWTTLRYGQVNLLLAVFVLWDLTRRTGHRWAGVGIGVAAGVKLAPAMFAVFLALCGLAAARRRLREDPPPGRWPLRVARACANPPLRQAAVAAGAFAATVLCATVLLPHDSWRFWTSVLFHTGRVGNAEDTANQSVRGVLARLLHTGDPGTLALAAVLLTAAAGLTVAVAAFRTRRGLPTAPAWAAVSCAVTALLVSPYSWSHHWVWCVPLVLLLGAEAQRRGGAVRWAGTALATAVFCSYALWWVPHSSDRSDRLELHQNAGQMLLSALYPLTAAAFLAAAAIAVWRARRDARAGRQEVQKE